MGCASLLEECFLIQPHADFPQPDQVKKSVNVGVCIGLNGPSRVWRVAASWGFYQGEHSKELRGHRVMMVCIGPTSGVFARMNRNDGVKQSRSATQEAVEVC